MAQSILDQMLDKGLVSKEETPDAKRAAERAAEPVQPEKRLPPPFEAPARGVIIESSHRPSPLRQCIECGTTLPPSHGVGRRCAECAADDA